MGDPPQGRTQFAFWLRNDLAARFRAFCEGRRLFQRDTAEKAIEAYLDVNESPRAGAPESAAALTTFPAPDQERGFDSRDGGKK